LTKFTSTIFDTQCLHHTASNSAQKKAAYY